MPNISRPAIDLLNRRQFLGQTATGLGAIALTSLLAQQDLLAAADIGSDSALPPIAPDILPATPLAPRKPHFTPRAKNVLVIFCSGALSQLDTFDYKPDLLRLHGTPLPDSPITFQGAQGNITQSPWKFRPRGQCGKMTSDLLPNLGAMVDDLAFIHSMTGKTNTHGPGENFMSTGFVLDGFPSMGAWASYALGSANQDLPAFVAIPDPRGVPQSGPNNWGPGFLPAVFQGTAFNASQPIRNLATPPGVAADADARTRKFLQQLNVNHAKNFPGDTELAARIASYELAARMQLSVPEVTDIAGESVSTLEMYGANDSNKLKAGFARNCILARRLIERGVRFVQLFNGAYAMGEGVGNWDGHKSLQQQYAVHGPILDQPAAALIGDLKRRGLLDETLVVFCTEFGRMPTFQKGASGRDHNPAGFTCFLAGAGVKPGISHGATDALGWKAQQDIATVHDLHATVLHLLGIDHRRLTFYHNGVQRRLTDVHGEIIRPILLGDHV